MSRLRYKLWVKTTAILGLFLLGVLWILSGIGVIVLATNEAYFDNGVSLHTKALDSGASYYRSYLYQHLETITYPDIYYTNEREFLDRFSEEHCNYYFTVTDENGQLIASNYTAKAHLRSYQYLYEFPSEYQGETVSETVAVESVSYTVNAGIRSPLTAKDRIYYYTTYTDLLIRSRYLLVILSILLPLTMLILVIYLCCAAGHHEDTPFVRPNAIDRIPLDVFVFILLLIELAAAWLAQEITGSPGTEWIGMLLIAPPLLLMLLLTVVTRIKCATLFKNTCVWMLMRGMARLVRRCAKTLSKLPLFWKTLTVWSAYSFAQLFLFLLFGDEEYLVFWIPEKLILTPLIVWIVLQLQSLRKSAKELANGHIDHVADTSHMIPALKEHGTDLNNIGNGMQTALAESLKSERMRLELISNVSHDIKTPLTSIINYVDLLRKDGLDSEQAPAYLEVLERQSWKLKKLTEDVIEASKATSGHIRANCQPLDSTILLQQALAEYSDRLSARSLEPIVRFEKQPLSILADGRLLWRVFDNVLSNIVKYAKSDTRVYIQAALSDERVCITFKNVSAAALDIRPDELTERFVRGDRARHTDGSGLGLSIAKSLTELQGGELSLDIDGDLFKLIISFPAHP